MESTGLLKSLALDTWYKAFVYVGLLLFVSGLTVEVRGITNGELLLLSAGIFFVGVGEWKNYKTSAWIKPPNVYTGGAALMQTKVRQADLVGFLLDCWGIVLFILGVWNVISRVCSS